MWLLCRFFEYLVTHTFFSSYKHRSKMTVKGPINISMKIILTAGQQNRLVRWGARKFHVWFESNNGDEGAHSDFVRWKFCFPDQYLQVFGLEEVLKSISDSKGFLCMCVRKLLKKTWKCKFKDLCKFTWKVTWYDVEHVSINWN